MPIDTKGGAPNGKSDEFEVFDGDNAKVKASKKRGMADEKELTSFVEEQLKKCKRDDVEMQAYLNISYFLGKQWVKIDRSTRQIAEPPREPWQIRFVANKIQPIVRTELAKITKNKFVMFVNPATSDDSDVKSARTGEKLIEWLEYGLSLQDLDRDNCLWGLTTGISFVKPFWNPNKGREYVDTDGTLRHEGDVDCCLVPLFELKFDTSMSNWNDVAWCCHEKMHDVEHIKAVYGVEVEPEDGLTASNLYDAKLLNLSTLGEGVEYRKRENSAVVHEYWEKPSGEYRNGRRITTCGDKVLLYEEDIGFGAEDESERELPFFPFYHIKVPGRLYPTCLVEQLIPLQREYNKSRSQIIENKNLIGNPILIAPRGCLDDEPTNEPGQFLEYNLVGAKPEYLAPPTMSADVYQNITTLDSEMEFVSGQHETSHGTTPTGVTSGTAIGFLQEQDDTKLGPTTANFISCKQRYMRYLLKMIQKKYDIARTVRIVGDNKRVETLTFKGADLTSIDVRVNEGTMYQTSKAAMQDFVIKMVQYGLLLPTNERDRQLIMKVLEFGTIDSVYSEVEQDAEQAEAENAKFERGDLTPDVRDFYNHESHIKAHNKLRKTESYKQLPTAVQSAVDAHVNAHLQYMMNNLLSSVPTGTDTGAGAAATGGQMQSDAPAPSATNPIISA